MVDKKNFCVQSFSIHKILNFGRKTALKICDLLNFLENAVVAGFDSPQGAVEKTTWLTLIPPNKWRAGLLRVSEWLG